MTVNTEARTIPGYKVGTWDIDPTHSEVGFSVRHMMVSKVRGRFSDFSGTITTTEAVEGSNVAVEIQLASVSTGNEQRDAHLRSRDFFLTEEHPTMTYRSTGLVSKGDEWELQGELSLNGITREVPVRFELNGAAPDAYGGYRIGFSGHAEISRDTFNVKWNQAIEGGGVAVSDKVTISLEVEAVLQES